MEVHRQDDATSLACRYDAMVLGGKVRAAVRMVTNKGGGGLYHPYNLDSKSGCPVIDVLCEKHPDCCVHQRRTLMPTQTQPTCLTPCRCTATRSAL
jgi:hypothetical protein